MFGWDCSRQLPPVLVVQQCFLAGATGGVECQLAVTCKLVGVRSICEVHQGVCGAVLNAQGHVRQHSDPL